MTDLLTLYQIADVEHIEVDCFELNKRESLSLMDEEGHRYIAVDPNKLCSVLDEKMKIAHELGHCITNSFYNQRATFDIRQKHENRADKWAIRQLVPKSAFFRALGNGYTEICQLAEYFNVTEDFMRKAYCYYMHGNLAVEAYF